MEIPLRQIGVLLALALIFICCKPSYGEMRVWAVDELSTAYPDSGSGGGTIYFSECFPTFRFRIISHNGVDTNAVDDGRALCVVIEERGPLSPLGLCFGEEGDPIPEYLSSRHILEVKRGLMLTQTDDSTFLLTVDLSEDIADTLLELCGVRTWWELSMPWLSALMVLGDIRDTIGNIYSYDGTYRRRISGLFIGPSIKMRNPAPGTIVTSLQPHISFLVSDFVPCFCDTAVFTPGVCDMALLCPIDTVICAPPDTGYVGYPYLMCSSVIVAVQHDTFFLGSEGMYIDPYAPPPVWLSVPCSTETLHMGIRFLPTTRVNISLEDAGISFAPGDTVRVCVLEAMDTVQVGPPNHLNEPWSCENLNSPIPECWEFYIAGTGIGEVAATPEGFEIKSIKPNPFNSSVEITYTIPEDVSDNIELAMFDILGRRVESLPVEKTKGEHSVIWQPQDVSSGMYFVRMKAGKQTITKKVMYLK